MKIDNQRNIYRIWISRLVMAIVFTLAIIVIIFVSWPEKQPGFWIGKYHVIILIAGIYILVNLINSLKSPQYVYYSDQGEMIILRYYPLSLFTSRKHSIEIPKTQFVKFELQPFLMGTQQKLILYQHFRNKVARYPAISLSALDREDRDRIIGSLEKHVKSASSG